MSTLPILYSFRRCPYAMRARMALKISGTQCELREVKLADKPAELRAASPKATVPVLVLPDGEVIEESLAIMHWALDQNDPESWRQRDDAALIARNDGPFKDALDRYKYPSRYGNCNPLDHRAAGGAFLADLGAQLAGRSNLAGDARGLVDIAVFPFVRQFANTDRSWFNSAPLPHVQDWLERHLSSRLFADIMNKSKVWKAGDLVTLFPA